MAENVMRPLAGPFFLPSVRPLPHFWIRHFEKRIDGFWCKSARGVWREGNEMINFGGQAWRKHWVE